MDQNQWLAERFEENRAHMRSVAYRMLGSPTEADDAVQEVWLRLARSDASGVDNLGGWLTTVIARICLDRLRSRKARRETPWEPNAPPPMRSSTDAADPEREALLTESISLALLMVLETLSPAERVAFVLHDLFDLPFEEIAPIVGRTPTAVRQLASRARRRVQGTGTAIDPDRTRQRELVDAFLAASRHGDFTALLAVLDPDVVLRADDPAVRMGAEREVRGAEAVANTFNGRAEAAQLALIDGEAGAVWAPGGRPRVVFRFTVARGRIATIDLVADPAQLGQFDVALLTD